MGKSLNLTGQRFGYLTAIKQLQEKQQRAYLWECQCDCGKICKVSTSRLRSGNTKSCGCKKYQGLEKYNEKQSEDNRIKIGTRFGKLVVIEDIGFRQQVIGHKRRWYKCICDCGNEKEIMGNSLKQGHVFSCGQCNFNSLGEYQIQELLNKNNIIFKRDEPFSELLSETGRRLRFDFIIYDRHLKPIRFIEFDGRQHFQNIDNSFWTQGDSFEQIKERDNIKNQFCLSKGYPLVRIPYTKLNHIKLEDIFGDKYLLKGGDD